MGKPVGPLCNLDCKYCFYLEKEELYPAASKFRMPETVLMEYIRQYIDSQAGTEVNFAWQGGEPTLLGVDYFRRILELQAKFAGRKRVSNAIQTNATLLDDAWCEFLRDNHFLVGVSIDGPRELHDGYRVDKGGHPTFDKVMEGLELLRRHAVTFNTLTVVHRDNARHPLEVYRFLKDIGSTYLQFIPLVERLAAAKLVPPPSRDDVREGVVAPWSVEPLQYGKFLVEIFMDWVRRDVGEVFVQPFEVALGNWLGLGSSLCIFAETCGRALALEHNGDVFSCDHYVYPRYKLGNVLTHDLADLVHLPIQRDFGNAKRDSLPEYCHNCDVRFACNGECPKNRFIKTPDGQPGLNYLCQGYKHFFRSIDSQMKQLAQLIRSGRPVTDIMHHSSSRSSPARTNAGCPCGSGLEFRQCHGKL
jgi:uncharacterized protein